MSLEETIGAIRGAHRERVFAMEQRKRMNLALGAYVRLMMGWRRDLPDKERAAIAKAAATQIDNGGAGMPFETMITSTLAAQEPFLGAEKDSLKALEKLAKSLPIWEQFGAGVRGFGPASLGVILAEAGDLSKYSTHSKLWKRMGVAVMGNVRQGGLGKNASAEEWIAHGYNCKRRSLLFMIGASIIKKQVSNPKDKATKKPIGEPKAVGRYGEAYLNRKAYEYARDPEIRPIVADRRAQRYMEKKLLRDLWNAWRRAEKLSSSAIPDVPAAMHLEAAE